MFCLAVIIIIIGSLLIVAGVTVAGYPAVAVVGGILVIGFGIFLFWLSVRKDGEHRATAFKLFVAVFLLWFAISGILGFLAHLESATVNDFCKALSDDNYQAAYDTLSPRVQSQMSLDSFTKSTANHKPVDGEGCYGGGDPWKIISTNSIQFNLCYSYYDCSSKGTLVRYNGIFWKIDTIPL